MKIYPILLTLTLTAQPAFAVMKLAPVQVRVSPVSGLGGVLPGGMNPAVSPTLMPLLTPALTLNASVLPAAQAPKPVTAMASVRSLGEKIKKGDDHRTTIAAAYDGGAAKDTASAAVAVSLPSGPSVHSTPSRTAGLLAHADGETPKADFTPPPAEKPSRETPPAGGKSIAKSVATFLLLAALVVAEYGLIGWAISHSVNNRVPTESEILYQLHGDELKMFGF